MRRRRRPEPPSPPPPPPPPYEAVVRALQGRPPVTPAPAPGPVTEALYARLTDEDLTQIEAALEGSPAELWAAATPTERRYQALLFAAWYGIESALDHTGLLAAMPPEDVHAMGRGPVAAGGDPYAADEIVAAWRAAGVEPGPGATVLDFGCSSGRVLRTLAAYRKDLHGIGCDPNGGAIAWAAEHLPVARFFTSPLRPPLDLPDASVDAAYAISIWSHFGAQAATAWLDELHRVVRPGGSLILTVHGVQTLANTLVASDAAADQVSDVACGMLRDGHVFVDVFGADGDWGVVDAEWGNAYLSLEWLAAHATPQWGIALLDIGRVGGTQDLILLERRGA